MTFQVCNIQQNSCPIQAKTHLVHRVFICNKERKSFRMKKINKLIVNKTKKPKH